MNLGELGEGFEPLLVKWLRAGQLSATDVFSRPTMTLSARNKLVGRIEEIQFGGVMAHVVIRVGTDIIESVITKRSADEMKLKVGDTVKAVIKSTEVMLEKD
jgi:molybdopterin-binding protein